MSTESNPTQQAFAFPTAVLWPSENRKIRHVLPLGAKIGNSGIIVSSVLKTDDELQEHVDYHVAYYERHRAEEVQKRVSRDTKTMGRFSESEDSREVKSDSKDEGSISIRSWTSTTPKSFSGWLGISLPRIGLFSRAFKSTRKGS